MKRSYRRSLAPHRRRGADTARLARSALLASLSSVALVALTGCVLAGTHERVLAERDGLVVSKRDLEEQIRLLKIANKSLDEHLSQLVDERESLLELREDLQGNLEKTRAKEAALARNLRQREEELAVTAAALVEQSAKVGELQGTYDGLVSDLEAEVAKGQIRIEQLSEGLQVGVSQEILFPSGSAALSRDGQSVIRTVAARLKDLHYAIAVEGHSDNLAITQALAKQYPTNWELAGARAASVVRLLVDAGVDPSNLTAVSHAATQPVADNKTSEGRALNRRIEIRLRPLEEGDAAKPAPRKPAGS